jgi:flagellar L-ring protein precursor FlgH
MMNSMTERLLLLACFAACGTGIPASAQSLYQDASFQSLTSDRRALHTGDSLTVLVVENASASASSNTNTSKTGAINGAVKGTTMSHAGSLSLGEDFDGKGTVARSGRVAAQLTVTVLSVADNQELFVSGRQTILVNGEKQLIELSGRVRPVDVSDTNTILSSRIADAKITYVGDGILAEKQKQGILTHILGWLGLL